MACFKPAVKVLALGGVNFEIFVVLNMRGQASGPN